MAQVVKVEIVDAKPKITDPDPIDTSTSLDTTASSLETDTQSDDEDDELLALRIAALESIKLKQEQTAKVKKEEKEDSQEPAKKAEFKIKAHPVRSNLVSIVTFDPNEEKNEKAIGESILGVTDFSRPPPPLHPPNGGYMRNSPPYRRKSPPSHRRRSLSPRRRSLSPRRRSPGPPPLRSRSPRGRPFSPVRRRSPLRRSRSPVRRLSKSPESKRDKFRSYESSSEYETDTDPETDEETEEKQEDAKEEADIKKEESVDKTTEEVDKTPADQSVDDVLKLEATAEMDEFDSMLKEFEDEVLTDKKPETVKGKSSGKIEKDQEDKKLTKKTKVKSEKDEKVKKKVDKDGKRLRKKVKVKTDDNKENQSRDKAVKSPLPRRRSLSPLPRRSLSPQSRRFRSPPPGRLGRSPRHFSPRRRSPSPRFRRASPGGRRFSPGRGKMGFDRTPSFSPETERTEKMPFKSDAQRSSPSKLKATTPDKRRTPDNRRLTPDNRRGNKDGKSTERKTKSKERKSLDKTKEKKLETDEVRQERKQKEEEERLKRLPTPEREKLLARRRKFEGKGKSEVNPKEGKKISLKSTSETDGNETTNENKQQKRPKLERLETTEASDVINMDVADTMDMFDEETNRDEQKNGKTRSKKGRKREAESDDEDEQPTKKIVTDLRVQLHKKRQAAGGSKSSRRKSEEDVEVESRGRRKSGGNKKHPLLRSVSPSVESSNDGPNSDGLDPDDIGPPLAGSKRKVVAPGGKPSVSSRLGAMAGRNEGGRESESPSPPPKSSHEERGRDREVGGLGSRRILVVKKDFSSRESSPEPQISIANNQARAGKGLKKSMHLRLGLPVEPSSKRSPSKSPRTKSPRSGGRMEITDDDIMAEIIRQKEKKLKKIKKKEKKLRKERKSKKDLKRNVVKELQSSEEPTPSEDEDLKGSVPNENLLDDSGDEELYKFFEDNLSPEVEKKPKLGKKSEKKKRDKKGDGKGLNLDLGKSASEEENLDILDKMKKKSDRRLKRLKEIERDKQLFA